MPYLTQEPISGDPCPVSGYLFRSPHPISPVIIGSVMSVTVSRYRMDTILPAFVNCLQSLPNLHTLELCHVHHEMTTKLKLAFEGIKIPSIRTIVLPTIAHHILRSCPNVEDVTCNVGDGSQILGTITASCPKVERISGVIPSPAMIKRWSGFVTNFRLTDHRSTRASKEAPQLARALLYPRTLVLPDSASILDELTSHL